ncbi:putative permease [anaerobic digester metagenome]
MVGLILAVLGGTIISRARLEDYVEPFVFGTGMAEVEPEDLTVKERIAFAVDQVKDIVRRVWLYVILGVGIGAAIHNWIPESIIAAILGQDKWYSVLIATFVGVPMYADIFGTLPIAEALLAKGVGLGTVLSFMMGVTALSLPSLIMLKKVVKPKLLAVFFSVVTLGIILIGYVFNMLGHLLI